MLALSIACTAAALAWLYLVAGARRLLADQPAAAPVAAEPAGVAGRGGGRPGQERGRDAAGHACPTLLGQEYPGALTVHRGR